MKHFLSTTYPEANRNPTIGVRNGVSDKKFRKRKKKEVDRSR